jgi:hypothetical protein
VECQPPALRLQRVGSIVALLQNAEAPAALVAAFKSGADVQLCVSGENNSKNTAGGGGGRTPGGDDDIFGGGMGGSDSDSDSGGDAIQLLNPVTHSLKAA